MTVSRNAPCPCGSGKKYKRCCLPSGKYERGGAASPDLAQQLQLVESAYSLGDIPRARRALAVLLKAESVAPEVYAIACKIEMREKNFEQAALHMARAVELQPKKPSYLYNYATALALQGERERAVGIYRQALAIKPDMWVVYHNLAHALRDLGRSDEAVDAYLTAFNSGALDTATMSQILLSMHLFCTDEHEELFDMHLRLGRKIAAENPRLEPGSARRGEREKIRLAYFSPRFSRDIVGYFFKPLFDNHNRDKFEIFLYSGTEQADELTEELRQRADGWLDVNNLSDAEMCQRIRADEIDILVDLCGHAPGNRIQVMARKPAPLQITMLDYWDTTGLEAVDCYVTDRYLYPEDTRQRFLEQLIYLDRPRLVYQAPDYAPDVQCRDESEGGLVFGSFNRHHKIVPAVIETWSELMRAAPDARLILKSRQFGDEDVVDNFRGEFSRRGVEAARIEFRGASPHQQMLQEYAEIDIALDTFPYNGGLTTCEALWMGTPVLTLEGNRIISRQSAGMLEAVGLSQFVARDAQEFTVIGSSWADRRAELNRLRRGLRQRMLVSPLCDGVAYTAELESHLLRIWKEKFG